MIVEDDERNDLAVGMCKVKNSFAAILSLNGKSCKDINNKIGH